MDNPHDQVEALLARLCAKADDKEAEKLSGQISLLCRAYMEPAGEDAFAGLKLTPNEKSILALLAARLGKTVRRGALLDVATFHHGWDNEPLPKVVDVYVCRLRRKLEGSGFAIETVWGEGYRLAKRQAAGH